VCVCEVSCAVLPPDTKQSQQTKAIATEEQKKLKEASAIAVGPWSCFRFFFSKRFPKDARTYIVATKSDFFLFVGGGVGEGA
jgi:hypothetical protein